VVRSLVSDLSGGLVPGALGSREDGGKGAGIKNFRKFRDLLVFLRSNIHKNPKVHLRSTWGHLRSKFKNFFIDN